MTLTGRFITFIIKLLLKILCKVEGDKLESVPRQGPLILVINHVNFLEVPLIYTLLLPRKVCGISKIENQDNWFLRILVKEWGAIPVNRETPGVSTFKEAGKALKEKKMLCIAPEGTRSSNGVLARGQQGVVFLALKNRVPILIVAHYGAENFWHNIKRLKRTRVTFVVGKPFTLASEMKITKDVYQEMTDQIMTRMAAMLPERYRGVYADTKIISDKYVRANYQY
ncbi:MAG: 1-acyl-sn-glycerol-3-phosphate acyltransferase [Candidatus Omnitrophica bacterium]|nr:1-acyl-sn-glycerol-3-phosphate acyltransferase [Candidatus Omnitrophota bacterium]